MDTYLCRDFLEVAPGEATLLRKIASFLQCYTNNERKNERMNKLTDSLNVFRAVLFGLTVTDVELWRCSVNGITRTHLLRICLHKYEHTYLLTYGNLAKNVSLSLIVQGQRISQNNFIRTIIFIVSPFVVSAFQWMRPCMLKYFFMQRHPCSRIWVRAFIRIYRDYIHSYRREKS